MIDEHSIAQRIREERRKNGISQEALGAMIGFTASYINKLEMGKKGTTVYVLAEIARVFNVSLDYLVFGDASADAMLARILNECSMKEKEIILESVSALKDVLIKHR